jgi:hypothetical protein
MRAWAVLGLIVVMVAGCIESDSKKNPDGETAAGVQIDPNRPDPTLGQIVTGPAVGPDLNATTAAAPRLVEGEWWRIRFETDLADQAIEVVRVVANASEEGYLIGMPHAGWLKEAIAFHSPAFGDVNLDLSYDTHNVKFEPVRFPMKTGDTWETVFATTTYIATVESADETTATITFQPPEDAQPTDPVTDALGLTGQDPGMRLVYDAQQHEIVRMESIIGTWEVLEHGYDFEGWITIPRGEHTAIDYGTFGPVSESHDPFERTIDVSGGFNRLTLMHLIVGITPGQYSIKSVAPDETVFETRSDSTNLVLQFYEATDPDGTWTVQDVVLGAGATYSMGIAYHQYDIRLPDGLRRADHSHPVIR